MVIIMKYLKCFKKHINIVLSFAIFTLGVIAIILGFTNEIFGCEFIKEANKYYPVKTTLLDRFDFNTQATSTFTLQGILEFASRVIENQNSYQLGLVGINITPEFVSAATTLKVLVIILFAGYGIFAIGSLFNFKQYTNMIASLLCLVFTLVIKNVAFKGFYSTDNNLVMINQTTKIYTALIVLWAIALFISLLQYGFNLYVKYSNKAEK